MKDNLEIGIDASRNRSGGAYAHLGGILTEGDPRDHGIDTIHVWTHRKMKARLPERSWLKVYTPSALERSLAHQIWWQYFCLPNELRRHGCRLLFTTDASTVCSFRPQVVMSQDMLSFEPKVLGTYGWSIARLRLEAILRLQKWALQRAAGTIFLTQYARSQISKYTGILADTAVIPHGIDSIFRERRRVVEAGGKKKACRCLYVSNAEIYKNHPQVIQAIAQLRASGLAVELTLVGGGRGLGLERMRRAIRRSDPNGSFIQTFDFVTPEEVCRHLHQADLFIFASTCENLPVTLLEAMSARLPIVCSRSGPMPEVLGDSGIYCDPEDPGSIAAAVNALARDDGLAVRLAESAFQRSRAYSWKKCAAETYDYLHKICNSKVINPHAVA